MPLFHEKTVKLERAEVGYVEPQNQQRPDKEEIVHQHNNILEVDCVDPSLAKPQRQLKNCQPVDTMVDQLSHRPGPSELTNKNNLQTEELIELATKEVTLAIKATSEGTATRPAHLNHHVLDECSCSLSPPSTSVPLAHLKIISDGVVIMTTAIQLPPAPALLAQPTAAIAVTAGVPTTYSTISLNIKSPQQTQAQKEVGLASPNRSSERNKSSRNSNAKAQSKARIYRFHEYKGPLNVQKNNQKSTSVDNCYEPLEQQLFPQWKRKNPRLLPASDKHSSSDTSSETNGSNLPVLPEQSLSPMAPKYVTNLEDMEVSDLNAELEKPKLRISGTKSEVIERLSPVSESGASNSSSAASNSGSAGARKSVSSPLHAQDESFYTMPSDEIITDQQTSICLLQFNIQFHATFQGAITDGNVSFAAFLQPQHQNQMALQPPQYLPDNYNNPIELIDPTQIEENSKKDNDSEINHSSSFLADGCSEILGEIQTQERPYCITENEHLSQPMPDIIDMENQEKKSQLLGDILDILIENGELPAIAATELVDMSSLPEINLDELMDIDIDGLNSLMCDNISVRCVNTSKNTCGSCYPDGPPTAFDLLIDDDIQSPQFSSTTAAPSDWDPFDFII